MMTDVFPTLSASSSPVQWVRAPLDVNLNKWCILFSVLFYFIMEAVNVGPLVSGRLQAGAAHDVRRQQKQTGAHC